MNSRQKSQEDIYRFPYHYLDLWDEQYRLLSSREYLGYLHIVKHLIRPWKGMRILDAGCGDGRFCYELKDENVKLIGVDFSEQAIRFAKAFNPGVEFLTQNLANLSLPQKFDAIVLIETLEHLPPKMIPKVLDRLDKHLAPGGKLVITCPSKNSPVSPKHYQHFDRNTLTKILGQKFAIASIQGYSKRGFPRKFYLFLKKIGVVAFIFSNRFAIARVYFKMLDTYFNRFLKFTTPEEALDLIVVCEKSP